MELSYGAGMDGKPTYKELQERCKFYKYLAAKHSSIEAIFESTHIPIFSIDRNYCYQTFNQAHADIMHSIYNCDISIGKCILDYQKVDEDRIAAKNSLDRALKGEQVIAFESSGLKGQRRYFEIIQNPIRDREGKVTGVSVVVLDITKRKQIEDERNELVHDLQTALGNVKVLQGLLPICSVCKKIRDDDGYRHQVEVYVRDRTYANFSHSYCPDCYKKTKQEIEQAVQATRNTRA